MDLHMSSLGTLAPGGNSSVLYATRCQVYWGLTYNVFFCYYSDLTSCRHRCKAQYTAHSGTNRLKHLFTNMYFNTTSYVIRATMCITLNEQFAGIKNLIPTMPLLFEKYSFTEAIYLLIRFTKFKFFPWNTNNTDGNSVNTQNTHTYTKHSERQTLKRVN